jgi:hypothetical protein
VARTESAGPASACTWEAAVRKGGAPVFLQVLAASLSPEHHAGPLVAVVTDGFAACLAELPLACFSRPERFCVTPHDVPPSPVRAPKRPREAVDSVRFALQTAGVLPRPRIHSPPPRHRPKARWREDVLQVLPGSIIEIREADLLLVPRFACKDLSHEPVLHVLKAAFKFTLALPTGTAGFTSQLASRYDWLAESRRILPWLSPFATVSTLAGTTSHSSADFVKELSGPVTPLQDAFRRLLVPSVQRRLELNGLERFESHRLADRAATLETDPLTEFPELQSDVFDGTVESALSLLKGSPPRVARSNTVAEVRASSAMRTHSAPAAHGILAAEPTDVAGLDEEEEALPEMIFA